MLFFLSRYPTAEIYSSNKFQPIKNIQLNWYVRDVNAGYTTSHVWLAGWNDKEVSSRSLSEGTITEFSWRD